MRGQPTGTTTGAKSQKAPNIRELPSIARCLRADIDMTKKDTIMLVMIFPRQMGSESCDNFLRMRNGKCRMLSSSSFVLHG
ncbi:unnamed protein product, partial [Mesorhabditis belari]|uniref:Uncharacterized protein n=1 Tax=Mesorhabditis belari TaxID=2138241 RepID=A0AAF3EHS1_9BILA